MLTPVGRDLITSGLKKINSGRIEPEYEDMEAGGSHRLSCSVRITQETHGHYGFILGQPESRPNFL